MEKYSDKIKGMDKYDKMLATKEIYLIIDEKKFEDVKTWLSGGDKAEWLSMFSTRRGCWKFFLECAKNNFAGSKERIQVLNKIMDMPTGFERNDL